MEPIEKSKAERLKELVQMALDKSDNPGSIHGLAKKIGASNATVRGWLMLTDRPPDVNKIDYGNMKAIASCLGWSLDRVDRYLEGKPPKK